MKYDYLLGLIGPAFCRQGPVNWPLMLFVAAALQAAKKRVVAVIPRSRRRRRTSRGLENTQAAFFLEFTVSRNSRFFAALRRTAQNDSREAFSRSPFTAPSGDTPTAQSHWGGEKPPLRHFERISS